VDSKQRAESELRMALALDSNLAEAHALSSDIKRNEQDYSAAERELKLAIELGPNSELVLDSYWRYLALMGEYDKAIAVGQRETDLDPLSTGKIGIVPFILLGAGRCDDALEGFRKLNQAYPQYIPAINNMGSAYICKGSYKEAAAEFEKTVPLQDDLG